MNVKSPNGHFGAFPENNAPELSSSLGAFLFASLTL